MSMSWIRFNLINVKFRVEGAIDGKGSSIYGKGSSIY